MIPPPDLLPADAAEASREEGPWAAPLEISLSPIGQRAWSLASESLRRVRLLQSQSLGLISRSLHEGSNCADWYHNQAIMVEARWLRLDSEFKSLAQIEPCLRPFESEREKHLCRHILAFRAAAFYNRYRVIFEFLPSRLTRDIRNLGIRIANEVLYWRSFAESLVRQTSIELSVSAAANLYMFRSACTRIGIEYEETLDNVLDFGRRGMLPPDILSYVEQGQLATVQRLIFTDVRDFPCVFFPSQVEHNRRLMISTTLMRILCRWHSPTKKRVSLFISDQTRLRLEPHTARVQVADEIAQYVSEHESLDREKAVSSLPLFQRLAVLKALERESFSKRWLKKSSEIHYIYAGELAMMVELMRGDQSPYVTLFGPYGERRVPYATAIGGTPC